MSSKDKDEKAYNAAPPGDVDVGTDADVEAVMKKFDRESNTRIWEGTPKTVIRYLMVAFSLYSIYITLFGKGLREVRLTRFLGMILIIGYLNFPAKKGDHKVNHIPWYDILIMIVGAAGFFYFSFNAKDILMQATKITRDPVMVIMAILSILAMMELCRRSVGIPILCVVGALLVYTFANVRFGKVIYDLFFTTSGVMNTPIDVCAKYIVVFIIFGAFLERTGISSFFIDLANSIAGSTAGGPAKVAVLSSALCGMVSGYNLHFTLKFFRKLYHRRNTDSSSNEKGLFPLRAPLQREPVAQRSQNIQRIACLTAAEFLRTLSCNTVHDPEGSLLFIHLADTDGTRKHPS